MHPRRYFQAMFEALNSPGEICGLPAELRIPHMEMLAQVFDGQSDVLLTDSGYHTDIYFGTEQMYAAWHRKSTV